MSENPLLQLIEHGQSYWLDNLTRGKIHGGELQRRVEEEGMRGVTSNPSIFMKAITGSNDYDDQIASLAADGHSTGEIYEALAVKDIQDACDVLRPLYNDSGGHDGFVSLEVSPHLAHETEATMDEARRLFQRVDRPNCLIKIPGTEAGLPAIEQMLYEGVNVNITLLFSVERYEQVALRYIRALERRAAEGKPIDSVASVASFFLSRIDVLVDQLLTHRIPPEMHTDQSSQAEELLGKVAIANAKLAYQSFQEIFGSARWKLLEEKGAKVQRPLWASTSTKNPEYSDVRYVEPLIGPETVNTLPDSTIEAFADHGIVEPNTVTEGVDEARQTLAELDALGIDLSRVTWQLENEGIQKFIDPFEELLEVISERAESVAVAK